MANSYRKINNSRSLLKKYAAVILCIAIVFLASACKHEKATPPVVAKRTYRMGFQNFPPKYDQTSIVQFLELWTQHADAAIISVQVPWDSLYSGHKPEEYVSNNYANLANYYRSKSFKLWVYIDPVNGLDRSADASDLAALGKSISQPDVQKVYGRFAFVMDSILKPDHLGLALETNLIRGASSSAIYQGVKNAANNTAALVRAYDKKVKLSVSIQADYAWGLSNSGPYVGIATDFIDFPFIQELGISSYPFFVFSKAQDIPLNYYSRLIEDHNVPVFISEGGWSSQTVETYTETPQKQQDYITRQGQLLAKVNAIGYFQLLFSDINPASLPVKIPDAFNLFAHIGLTDTTLKPKPSLNAWDALLKTPIVSGN